MCPYQVAFANMWEAYAEMLQKMSAQLGGCRWSPRGSFFLINPKQTTQIKMGRGAEFSFLLYRKLLIPNGVRKGSLMLCIYSATTQPISDRSKGML